jgi:hypothetical protein
MDHDPSDFVEAGLSVGDVLAETARREREAGARAAALVDAFLGIPSSP